MEKMKKESVGMEVQVQEVSVEGEKKPTGKKERRRRSRVCVMGVPAQKKTGRFSSLVAVASCLCGSSVSSL